MSTLNYSLEDFKKFTVKVINLELLTAISNAPLLDDKKRCLALALDEMFKDVDLSKSFETPLCIMYDEIFYEEIIVGIHYWLRTKCANIENIILITAEHTGLARWWKDWCKVHHERSFTVVEMSYGYSHFLDNQLLSKPDTIETTKNKNIQHYFNLYGGTYPSNDKMYLVLKALELYDYGIIECLGEFYPKQSILDYVENITYYTNQQDIDHISSLYDQYIHNNKMTSKSFVSTSPPAVTRDSIFFSGHQYHVDGHCFASIVRETVNDRPFSSVTEKTLRAFVHQLAVIPTGYLAVDELELQGFWFPHDIIDYSYQHEPDYSRRITKLIDSVKQLVRQHSLDDLQKYYSNNLEHFHHNVQLVYTIRTNPLITYRKLNQCDI